jgi:hypothetical protein
MVSTAAPVKSGNPFRLSLKIGIRKMATKLAVKPALRKLVLPTTKEIKSDSKLNRKPTV